MADDLTEAGKRRTKMIELFLLAQRKVELEVRVLVPATVVRFIPPAAGPYGPLPAMVELQLDLAAVREGLAGDADLAALDVFKPSPTVLSPGAGEIVMTAPPFYCPVSFPGFAGAWLRGVLLPGEQGRVHFTDRALGRWLVTAAGVPGAPGLDRGIL